MTATATPPAAASGAGARSGQRRGPDRLVVAVLAAIAYIPLLLTQPGQVGADTKTYLYLDPGRLLGDAPYLWDTRIGLGTITHQNIGYLWPMGPFYWVLDTLGLPDWVAQRLWLGSVLFAAGMGVRFLLRTISPGYASRRGAVLVACLAYMLSPYLLEYSARISVILLPWAALGWLIGLTARALRNGGWRDPALFALVVLTVGGVNATALVLVGLGPLLWVVNAVWFTREVPARRAAQAVGRIGALTLLTSLWWLAGLALQGRYGLPILRYTETYKTVAEVSTAPEVLRGLGYWFFYGNDKLGPWIEPSVTYTQNVPVLVLSYLLPLAALTAAVLVRWRHRAYFIVLLVVGTLTAVGSHPWGESSLLGALFRAFTRTDTGLSMRSTPRATPLVVLALALFLGAGVAALGRRLPRLAVPVAGLVSLLIVANLPTLWTGQMVAENLRRPEEIPSYWTAAIAAIDAGDPTTRVLELPGADFASYRWGNTVDPVTPGLTDRHYVARELFPWGSPPSTNLLNAFDRRLHEDDLDPQAVATVARLLGVGDIVYRADLQYERYRTARPRHLWDVLLGTPGLAAPRTFGEPVPNVAGPEQTMVDEIELGTDESLPDPPPVSLFEVLDALPMIRAHATQRALLVAGDGEGLVDAASIGLLDPTQAVFYSAALADRPEAFARIYGADAELLVTDTNRKRARRWGTLRETNGYTERAGAAPDRYDPGDQRLDLFPDAGDDAATVSEQRGGVLVTATDYGNPITYTANDRAALALDGDPRTAWRVAAVDDPIGHAITVQLDTPVTADRVELLQPVNLVRNRWIARARLTFDDGPSVDIDLDDSSRVAPGQVVRFPERSFSELRIEILDTNIGKRPRYDGLSGVGFAEIGIPGVRLVELIRPPTDLLDAAGASSIDHRLTLLFTRLRSNPAEPVRTDEEEGIARVFTLPTGRAFALTGQARLSAYLPDETIDRIVGIPGADAGGVTVRSEERLPGSLARRGSAAVDGDLDTHWSSRFIDPAGQWLEVTAAEPVTFGHLDLAVVADGRHSVATRLRVAVDGDEAGAVVVDVPDTPDQADPGAATTHRVELGRTLTGRTIRVVVEDVRSVETRDWYSNTMIAMPVAIAELGIPGVEVASAPTDLDTGCRDDLITVDGRRVPVRITGTTEDALARRALEVQACPGADEALALGAGEHVLMASWGRDRGFDLDRLALTSAAGGAPLDRAGMAADPPPTGPPLQVIEEGPVSFRAEVDARGEPFWLSLGQSYSPGWRATVNGRDLGEPVVIDGYANGWYVQPDGPDPVTVEMTFAPQRIVWIALAVSGLGLALCLALVVLGRRPPPGASAIAPGPDLDPELVLPGEGPPSRVPARVAGWLALGLGVFALVNLPWAGWLPALAVAVGAAALVAFRAPAGRTWLGAAGVGSIGLAWLYVIQSQVRHGHVADFIWPLQFERVHVLGLIAVFLLLGEAVRDLAARRPDSGDPSGPVAPPASTIS